MNNLAWKRTDAIEVLGHLGDTRIAVAGGDVYRPKDGHLSLTFDNWSCEQRPNEPEEAYARRSQAHGVNFVVHYGNPENPDPWFALVLRPLGSDLPLHED